jgi:type I restriction enzyme S subunit
MSDHTNGRAPKHWKRLPLGELVDILDSRRVPVNAKEREGRQGTVPYYGATGQVGWIDEYLFDEELVLLGEDGAPFFDSTKQKAYVVRGPSWVNNHAHVLRTRDGMPSAFLKHQLDQVDYRPFVSGTTRAKLPQGPMRQIGLLVPPADEQRSIVAAIESHFSRLDAATATLERVQRNLERYRASVLKAAVEGRLVPTEAELAKKEGRSYEPASVLLKRILAERRRRWEEAELAKLKAKGKAPTDDRWKASYEEPAAPDTDGLPELPEGWCWASLEQLLTHLTSGSRDWTDYYDRGTGVFLMAQNVRPGRLDLSFVQHVDPPPTDASCARSQVEEGDLLVTIVGANTGDVCRIPRPLPEHYVCQSVALMRPAIRSLSRYLEAYLNSPPGQAVFDGFMYGQGRPHLGFEQLETTPVPLPPADEAERIVALVEDRISVGAAVAAPIGANKARIARLRQSILKWAFDGRLVALTT